MSETPDELAVEHAISETLGQGPRAAAALGLEVERASEPEEGSLPREIVQPSSGIPEPVFLSVADDPPMGRGGRLGTPPSPTLDAVEVALGEPHEVEAPARDGDAEPPSSSEPLPWLAAPEMGQAAEESRASRERDAVTSVDDVLSAIDTTDARRSADDSPASRAGRAPVDASTVVGANDAVAEALERVAARIRAGEIRVPAIDASTGEAGALAAALAVLLGVRS